MDLAGALMLPSVDVVGLGRPEIPHPGLLLLGLASIVGVPLFLWLAYPRFLKPTVLEG
jgi:hypothetical protein